MIQMKFTKLLPDGSGRQIGSPMSFGSEDISLFGCFAVLATYVNGDGSARGVAGSVLLGQGCDENVCHSWLDSIAEAGRCPIAGKMRLDALALMPGHQIGASSVARPLRRFLLDTAYFSNRSYWSVGDVTDIGIFVGKLLSWYEGLDLYDGSVVVKTGQRLLSLCEMTAGRGHWLRLDK
jgi:hypothetical protein